MFGQDLNKLMENRDGYVYRTLFKHKPMFQQIMRQYDISDEQREYDILMDFYFYLRGDGEPFAMLDGIKNEKALPSWRMRSKTCLPQRAVRSKRSTILRTG